MRQEESVSEFRIHVRNFKITLHGKKREEDKKVEATGWERRGQKGVLTGKGAQGVVLVGENHGKLVTLISWREKHQSGWRRGEKDELIQMAIETNYIRPPMTMRKRGNRAETKGLAKLEEWEVRTIVPINSKPIHMRVNQIRMTPRHRGKKIASW